MSDCCAMTTPQGVFIKGAQLLEFCGHHTTKYGPTLVGRGWVRLSFEEAEAAHKAAQPAAPVVTDEQWSDGWQAEIEATAARHGGLHKRARCGYYLPIPESALHGKGWFKLFLYESSNFAGEPFESRVSKTYRVCHSEGIAADYVQRWIKDGLLPTPSAFIHEES